MDEEEKKSDAEPELFIPKMCNDLTEIEAATRHELGEEAGHFLVLASDCLEINLAVMARYTQEEQKNLVFHTSWGMLRELRWMHFLFLAGNYPLVNARLRYLWEATFRAYFVEQQEDPAVRAKNLDEKIEWLENHDPRLDWKSCVDPMLRSLFPMAEREKEVRDFYSNFWKRLNAYAHPSEYVLQRMVDDSAIHVKDSFDAEWARDTIATSSFAFDLIWLAILRLHGRSVPVVAEKKLSGKYPCTDILLGIAKGE